MLSWIQECDQPTWEPVYLHGGPCAGQQLSLPHGLFSIPVGPPFPLSIYVRTRQHCAIQRRVYATLMQPWPSNSTLGWRGPEGFVIASDLDPGPEGRWRFILTGHGHTLRFSLSRDAVNARWHDWKLSLYAARIERTTVYAQLPARVE